MAEHPRPGLREDTRGAVLVVGIVLGALLVGALWHLASVGDAIIWREHAQDAADAAAFENAVWNARGMNVIVSINIVMSMVLSLLVLWRVTMIAVAIGIYVSAAACAPTFGFGCAAATVLTDIEIWMLQNDNTVATNIIRILAGINIVEMAVASATPVISTAESSANTLLAYDTVPVSLSLSLLPSHNVTGIYNAVTCLGSGSRGGKPDGAKPGGTPGGGTPGGGTPGGGAPAGGPPASGPNPPAGGATRPGGLERAAQVEAYLNARMGMPVSLPVQDEGFSVLCNKAGAFVMNNVAGLLEKGLVSVGVSERIANFLVFPLDIQRNVHGFVTGMLPGVFCAPIGAGMPIGMTDLLERGFKSRCHADFEQNHKDNRAGFVSGPDGTEPGFRAEDGRILTEMDWKQDCTDRQRKNANGKLGGALGSVNKALPELECGKPAKVWELADNGSVFMRSFSSILEAPDTRRGDQGLDVGDGRQTGNVTAVQTQPITAHAEMYFDCEDEWTSTSNNPLNHWNACGPNSMWQIRWRARLRRVHSLEDLFAASGQTIFGGYVRTAVLEVASLDVVNRWLARSIGGTGLSEMKDNPIFDAIISRAVPFLERKLAPIVERATGALGSVGDWAGAGLQSNTSVDGIYGMLNMGELRATRRDDELRAFIRSQAARSATVH